MKKSFVKIVTIFSIIFMSFFINKSVVSAETCRWISPLTYLNENNLPSLVQSQVVYKTNNQAKHSETQSLTSFRLKYDGSYRIGYAVSKFNTAPKGNPSLNGEGGYNIYLNGTYNAIEYDTVPSGDCSNYKYVKAETKFSGSRKIFKVTLSNVTESEYLNYLKTGGQYKNLFDSNRLYGLYTLHAFTNDEQLKNMRDESNESGIRGFDYYSFGHMITTTGGTIYFVNTKQAETYPTQKLTTVKQMISLAQDTNGNALSQERKDKILSGFSQVVDTNTKNKISYTKAYYNATKTKWATYMRENLDSRGEATRREYFGKWFNKSIARYTLEENPQQFLVYWRYKFPNDCTTSACDFDGNGNSDSDREVYNGVINAINNIATYTNGSECLSQIQNNPCISICSGTSSTCPSGTALDQCQNSETYRTCHSCVARCANVESSSAKEQCYNECTHNSYSSMRNSVRNAQQESANSFATTMLSISEITLPHFDSDTFEPYTVKCEDVKVFHTIYVILQIAAPIAVIIFGSLDYAKAVIASDVEKMEKSKKKFPKRLLLLVLFVVIPIVINAILSLYSMSTDNEMDTSLMYCIIKG